MMTNAETQTSKETKTMIAVNNKIQMLQILNGWKVITGTKTLPERKGAHPVYLKLDAPTLNLVKIENIGKGLFRVTMITETR